MGAMGVMFRGVAAFACAMIIGPGATAAPTHPLDPLDREEIAAAIRIVVESGLLASKALLADVSLQQPEKATLADWDAGGDFPRKARITLRMDGETVEAVANLGDGSLEVWRPLEGVQPRILSGEWKVAQARLKEDPRWRAAMKRRGLDDPDAIFCDSLSAGFTTQPELDRRRLIRMPCFLVENAKVNVYARPIEGVIGTVDLDSFEVLEVSDSGPIPIPAAVHDLPASLPEAPDDTALPFEMDGRLVRWEDWSFHLGFDARFGPLISLVDHHGDGSARRVLHQGHISEVFVPYMDPDPNWSWRTYLDAGEYGLGVLSSPLTPGVDCPAQAFYMGVDQVNASGTVYRRNNVVCVFERTLSDPLWRHYEGLTGVHSGRRARELVVRSIASVAHYDYVFDWSFTLSGEIRVAIGATGIDSVKAVAGMDPSGTLVAPGLLAVFHDHHFSVRLDLDVDGPANRFVRHRLIPQPLAGRRGLWKLEPETLQTEGAIARDAVEVWRVENPHRQNALGQSAAYELRGGDTVSTLPSVDAAQKRAAFSAYPMWVTRHKSDELYAAGPYPNQSAGGEGLPRYADGESIVDEDLVLWATVGFNHVTRAEDWPVLSTMWKSITLRPAGFFDLNPAFRAP